MITNLKVGVPSPQPGMEIACDRFEMKNYRMHQMATGIARLVMFALESDTNNSSAQVVAEDVRNLWAGFAEVKRDFDRALKYKDAPQTQLEEGRALLLPRHSEIQRMNNRPFQLVASELLNLAHVLLFNDSSNQQYWVGAGPQAKISTAMEICENVMSEEIGDGQPGEGGFNVGPIHADYSRLGTLAPDVDLDQVTLHEPSVGPVRPSTVPDSKDLPSDLPESAQ